MRVLMNVALTVVTLAVAQGTSPAGTVVARLAGQWTGSGVVNNAQVSAKAEFGPVLANRFTKLAYTFTVAGVGDVFEGHAYYACAKDSGTCRGNWFDSQGSAHVLTATQTADALTSEWGDGTTAAGPSIGWPVRRRSSLPTGCVRPQANGASSGRSSTGRTLSIED